MWEMFFYGLNEAIVAGKIGATDMGGSMLVHLFGAYFGVAASFFFQPVRTRVSQNLSIGYTANILALFGSIFLWMFWPSFNGALATGVQQQRVFVNTVLSISASCISSAFTSRVLHSKLEMEIMINATLAGGVAIGSSCDLVTKPWISLTIGSIAGIVSSLGYAKYGPWLDKTIALNDTCGVHSLHGVPAIIGFVSSIFICRDMKNNNFPKSYINDGDFDGQSWKQLWGGLISLGISLVSGAVGGHIASQNFLDPVHSLFRDDDHMLGAIIAYPKSFLVGGDEAFEEVDRLIRKIQDHLNEKKDDDAAYNVIDMLEGVWTRSCGDKGYVRRGSNDANKYLTELCTLVNCTGGMNKEAYDQIFGWADTENTGLVEKGSMSMFFEDMVKVKF